MRYISSVLGLIGLAVAATALAAPSTDPADQDTITLRTLFEQLDRNGDDVLARDELEANPVIADASESFDTAETIQQPTDNTRPGGVTYEQFAAGMQAAGHSGAFGPAVSGGQRYLEYLDGSREPLAAR